MKSLGLDIGGANIKWSDESGIADSKAFPLWKSPEDLSKAIRAILAQVSAVERVAVTMTGELADCFADKREGVNHILNAVEYATAAQDVHVYCLSGEFLTIEAARETPNAVMAANWHALAQYCGRLLVKIGGVLLDMGSTTTDVIPLDRGGSATGPATDRQRLCARELLYLGVRRTPLCATLEDIVVGEIRTPLAREFFATTDDVYLLLGEVAESSEDYDTADGRSRTQSNAHARMARMVCCDRQTVTWDEAVDMAAQFDTWIRDQLVAAIREVAQPPKNRPLPLVLAGEGEFVLKKVIPELGFPSRIVSLSHLLGAEASRSACAYAVAMLLAENKATSG